MTGYEVSINGENIAAAIEKGVLTLIITRLNNDVEKYIKLDLTGRDSENNTRPRWKEMDLKEGDEIVIKIKDIEQVSVPFKVSDINPALEKESTLKKYRAMKDKLEKDGLI